MTLLLHSLSRPVSHHITWHQVLVIATVIVIGTLAALAFGSPAAPISFGLTPDPAGLLWP